MVNAHSQLGCSGFDSAHAMLWTSGLSMRNVYDRNMRNLRVSNKGVLLAQALSLKHCAAFCALFLPASPALVAAPRKLHPGTVKCTLIRYRPKIRVDRYDFEVITYENRSSEVFAAIEYSFKFPTKVARSHTILNTNPFIVNKWKDFTPQADGLVECWR